MNPLRLLTCSFLSLPAPRAYSLLVLFHIVISPVFRLRCRGGHSVLHGATRPGVAVGPAALFVLRGLVCLQCNVKLPKPGPCGTCKLTFCGLCQKDHFCIGKLNLPRGVAEAVGDGGGAGRAKAGPGGTRGSYDGGDRRDGRGGRRGAEGETGAGSNTRWELGSAIGDDWEALFSEVRGGRSGEGKWAESGWGMLFAGACR